MNIDREWVNEVKVFSVVAEKLSFSNAAIILGVSASAVSKTIGRMEERLKTKLFLRTTRAVQLTEVGMFYLNRSREILGEIQNLENQVEHEHQALRGILRISAPLMLGHAKILPIALRFQTEFPEVRVELDLTDRVADILEERIDIAIRMTATPLEAFIARKLGRDERVLCASPRYLKNHGNPNSPKDLVSHFGVIFCKADTPVSWKLFPQKNAAASRGFLPKPKIHLSSIMAVHEAAKAGLGIADLPKYLVEEDFKLGKLAPVLADYTDSPRFVWAIYSGSRAIPKKIKLFVEYLQEHFGNRSR